MIYPALRSKLLSCPFAAVSDHADCTVEIKLKNQIILLKKKFALTKYGTKSSFCGFCLTILIQVECKFLEILFLQLYIQYTISNATCSSSMLGMDNRKYFK